MPPSSFPVFVYKNSNYLHFFSAFEIKAEYFDILNSKYLTAICLGTSQAFYFHLHLDSASLQTRQIMLHVIYFGEKNHYDFPHKKILLKWKLFNREF